MPTPEQRFEVPPEYAEVYERAYRRAYEEGQDHLNGGADTSPPIARRGAGRGAGLGAGLGARLGGAGGGRRIAVPAQRTSRRAPPKPRIPQQRENAKARHAGARVAVVPPRGPKRRAVGSTWLPLAGILGLGLLLLVGGFVLGRVTAGISHQATNAGSVPAATASASEGLDSATPSATPPATPSATATPTSPSSSGPYRGPVRQVRVAKVRADCHAKPGRSTSGKRVSYAVANVLDAKPTTAWRCHGRAIGKRLRFTLPRSTEIVRVGLVPGYAKTDPITGANRYAQNNRITRVTWIFDNGTRVDQSITGGVKDRSFRVLRISEIKTRTITLVIKGVRTGPRYNTMISTVRFMASARDSS